MYIRTDVLGEYLTGTLEPYDMADWLKPYLYSRWQGDEKRIEVQVPKQTETKIEVYRSESLIGRVGFLDMFNLKDVGDREAYLHEMTVPSHITFAEVRSQLAERLNIERLETIRLWVMRYSGLGDYTTASMSRVAFSMKLSDEASDLRPLCLWMAILQSEDDITAYGTPDAPARPVLHQPHDNPESIATSPSDDMEPAEHAAPDDAFTVPAASSDHTPSHTSSSMNTTSVDAEYTHATVQNHPPQWSAELDQATTSATPNQDTTPVHPFQINIAELPESTPEPLPVEHGHLVDALQEPDPAASINETASSLQPNPLQAVESQNVDVATEALFASLVAADGQTAVSAHVESSGAVAERSEQPQSELPLSLVASPNQTSRNQFTRSSSMTSTDEADMVPRGNNAHSYGFVQTFDVEKQNFVVKMQFFAHMNADVRTTVKKLLGYSEDRDILVWQRVKAYNTCPIYPDTTFSDINFRDGVDIIVGDILSEEQKAELLNQGKSATPHSLSRMLWMAERRHPTLSFTGQKTLHDFGGNYYSGPMVRGRYHGDNGTLITSNGHKYVGPFVADEKSGSNGTMTYQNGDVYTGMWLKDEKHGSGTFVEKRTGNTYTGGFQNGKRWGEGVTHWRVADEQRDMCQICYDEEVDALFYECGHVCACVECARQCDSCPICRKDINKVVKMYRS